MKRIIINTLIFLIVVAAVAFALMNNKEEMKEEIKLAQLDTDFVPVSIDPLKKFRLKQNFDVNGYLESNREVSVAAEIAGVITSITTKDGAYVKANQLLARIDDRTIKESYELAKANFKKIEKDKERTEHLFKVGGISQAELDNINLAHLNAKSQLVSAEKAYDNTFIKAPFSGVNDNRYIELGSYVKTGDKLFDIVDLSKLKMIVNVPESQIQKVEKGMLTGITIQAVADKSFRGIVSKIGVRTIEALTFPVEIEISNSTEVLKSGMFGTAVFELPQKEVLVVDRNAIVGGLKQPQVFVYQDSLAMLRSITIGERDEKNIEVIGGLKEGDLIITSGQINLSEGMKVSIQKQ